MLMVTTGRLELDHVVVEPLHEVFGLLAADALVDHLGELEVGILLGEHRVDVAEISAAGRDRVADGHDLVAGLELEFLGRIGGRGADQRQDQGENLANG